MYTVCVIDCDVRFGMTLFYVRYRKNKVLLLYTITCIYAVFNFIYFKNKRQFLTDNTNMRSSSTYLMQRHATFENTVLHF